MPLFPQIFPELPVPKAGENVDKVQQYTDDFAETKKRLEEARQRRLDEKRKQEVGCSVVHDQGEVANARI